MNGGARGCSCCQLLQNQACPICDLVLAHIIWTGKHVHMTFRQAACEQCCVNMVALNLLSTLNSFNSQLAYHPLDCTLPLPRFESHAGIAAAATTLCNWLGYGGREDDSAVLEAGYFCFSYIFNAVTATTSVRGWSLIHLKKTFQHFPSLQAHLCLDCSCLLPPPARQPPALDGGRDGGCSAEPPAHSTRMGV